MLECAQFADVDYTFLGTRESGLFEREGVAVSSDQLDMQNKAR